MKHGPDVMKIGESRCLECGNKLNAIGTVDPSQPATLEPGEMAICACIKCGAVMTLGSDMKLRGFTDEEMEELLRDQVTMHQLASMVRSVHLFKHQRG